MYTQADYDTHLLPSRSVYVQIDLLNSSNVVVNRLEGISTSGQVSVSSDSLIRRTANLNMVLSDDLLPSEQSQLWITNKIRLFVGLEDYSDTIHYFNLGTYCIKNPSIDISVNERTISIELVDLMYLFEQKPLENITKINSGVNISTAMRTVVQSLGGETRVLIDSNENTNPYDLEFNADQSVLDIITSLRDLYMNWECFYNTDGYFIFQETPNRLNDPIIWDFGVSETDFRITSKVNIQYDLIKNYVKVIGHTNDLGVTATATVQNTDSSSPFAISKIGKRALVISDDKYYTDAQCLALANYQLFKHGNFNEQVSISCVPIYFLDVNMLVNFDSEDDGLVGKYCISSLSIPLDSKSEMNFSAYKIYE